MTWNHDFPEEDMFQARDEEQNTNITALISEMLEMLKNCFVMTAGRVEASCRSCLSDWPNHHPECKLAAVIAKAEEVVG